MLRLKRSIFAIFLTLLVSFDGFNTVSIESKPKLVKFCEYKSADLSLVCTGFSNLADLTLDDFSEPIKLIHLKPTNPILFDDDLDLSRLNFQNNYDAKLENFKGFDLLSNPFSDVKAIANNLFVLNSTFQFLLNNNGTFNCDFSLVYNSFTVLFASFANVHFDSDTKYPQNSQLCPLVFKNSKISTFKLDGVYGTNFGFRPITYSNPTFRLNSKINTLEIKASNIDLTKSVLNRDTFQEISNFKYSNILGHVDADLFKDLKNLTTIEFELDNFYEFFNQNRSWFNSLNTHVNVSLNNSLEIQSNQKYQMKLALTDNSKTYDFPNSDFCLFYELPLQRLVFPVLKAKENIECSCTLVWLLQNWEIVSSSIQLSNPTTKSCPFNGNFDKYVKDCQFDKRIRICKGENIQLEVLTSAEPTSRSTTGSTTTTRLIFPNNATTPKKNINTSVTTINGVAGGIIVILFLIFTFHFVFTRITTKSDLNRIVF